MSMIGWAHGLMVLWGGKHGNSSNFADPLGAVRSEDRSSELKLIYRQILHLFTFFYMKTSKSCPFDYSWVFVFDMKDIFPVAHL